MAKLDVKVEIDHGELSKQGKSHANQAIGIMEKRRLKSPERDWGEHDGGNSWKIPSLIPSIGKGQTSDFCHGERTVLYMVACVIWCDCNLDSKQQTIKNKYKLTNSVA